jgi:small subunit ribosomal protein S9
MEPEVAREVVLVPIHLIGEIRNKIDLSVKVHGGGFMGQAFASAVAISRALAGEGKGGRDPKDHPLSKSIREEIRRKITEYDRHFLAGDPRQTESKKFGGPSARRRKQKSYR